MSNFKHKNIDQNNITLKEVLVIIRIYISSACRKFFNVSSGEMVNLNTFFKNKGMVLSTGGSNILENKINTKSTLRVRIPIHTA
jgi:hypothetical protein